MNKSLAHFLWVLVIISCSQPQKEVKEAQKPEDPSYPAFMSKAFQTHNIEAWNKARTLKYELPKDEGSEKHTIDLKSRKVLLTSDEWTIGFDGSDVWLTPDSTAHNNPRFYHNLYYYFFGLPYLANDPGVNLSNQGKAVVNGKEYSKVLMTFGENVGDAPDDQYILYFDDQGILRLINYSGT